METFPQLFTMVVIDRDGNEAIVANSLHNEQPLVWTGDRITQEALAWAPEYAKQCGKRLEIREYKLSGVIEAFTPEGKPEGVPDPDCQKCGGRGFSEWSSTMGGKPYAAGRDKCECAMTAEEKSHICPDCNKDWGHSYCGTCGGTGKI